MEDTQKVSAPEDCWYCSGARSPCTCTADCGARAEYAGHVCGKAPAEVIRAWLRGTGLYSEEEVRRRVP